MNVKNIQVNQLLQNDPTLIGQLLRISELIYRGYFQKYKFQGMIFTDEDILFTDEEFDKLKDENKESYEIAKTTIQGNTNRLLIQHPLCCGTLEKYVSKKFLQLKARFQKKQLETFILSPKYDGVSLRVYISKDRYYCLTRGEIDFGFDITNKCSSIINQEQIKKIQQFIVQQGVSVVSIRGEIICKTTTQLGQYSSFRSLVSGKISNQEILQDVDYVPYEFIIQYIPQRAKKLHIKEISYEQQLAYIKEFLNFELPVRQVKLEDFTEQILEDFNQKIDPIYETDGVVIRSNALGFEDRVTPSFTVAYKFETQYFDSVVKGFTWSPSKQGFMVPTVIFDKVEIDGQTIEKATGHNLNYIFTNGFEVGSKCKVKRANQVIPHIEGTIQQVLSDEQKLELMEKIKPEKCSICDSLIVINKEKFEFECQTKRCRHWIYLHQIKEVLSIKNFGDKKIFDTFKKECLIASDFDKWFIKFIKEKQLIITFPIIARLFEPGIGEKKAETCEHQRIIQKVSDLQFPLITKMLEEMNKK